NIRVRGLIGRIVTALAVVIRILIVNAGIIAIRIWIVVIVGVVIVGVPVPREESEIENEPITVDETATVPVPPVVGMTVPIAMPITRAPGEDVIARTSTGDSRVAVCNRTH